MGHLRTGKLPRSKTWLAVIESVEAFGDLETGLGVGAETSKSNISEIANKTLDASNQALRRLPQDPSIQRCFTFLVALAVAGQSNDVESSIRDLGVNLEGPSKIHLSKALRIWLHAQSTKNQNPEFESLARKATVDTIAGWLNEKLSSAQLNIFTQTVDPFQPWREASDGRGFCELSRMFFSNFTSRYLKYFLSRTASSQLRTIADRDRLEKSIHKNIDNISRHAFETSKIVQSFSAGWFNKNAIGMVPSEKKTEGFLRYSFEKIREELRREKEAQ